MQRIPLEKGTILKKMTEYKYEICLDNGIVLLASISKQLNFDFYLKEGDEVYVNYSKFDLTRGRINAIKLKEKLGK